jgi:hypothetical protein
MVGVIPFHAVSGNEGQTMNWMRPRAAEPRRPVRPALLCVVAAAAVLLGACSAEPGTGSTGAGSNGAGSNGAGSNGAGGSSATVTLDPPSGKVSLTPTWATSAGCPAAYQGSAIFRIIYGNGLTTDVSPATNTVTTPFHGTLLANIAIVQAYTNIPNGHTAELIVICFSGDSLTGNPHVDMSTYITFSADGKTYTTSSTPPAGSTPATLAS